MIKKVLKKIIGLLLRFPYLPERFFYFGFNGRVAIEPTNACNLRCRLCPTWQYMKREKGFMNLKDFKAIIDENVDIFKRINMIFAGEPLLNKDVFKMAKYVEERDIEVLISTNTTLFDVNKIEELFDSNLSYLIVCLDGTSKETHEQYRQGSNFEQIKENIRKICQVKKEKKAKKPYIALQFLVMKQNEHEIKDIIKLAKSLGVDCLDLKTLSLGSFVDLDKKIKLAKENLPRDAKYSRFVFKKGVLREKSKPRICSWMRQALIFWNGDVSMCCYDVNGDLIVGNVFKDGGFKKILKSKKYREYRKMAIQRKFKLCRNCNYSAYKATKKIIFKSEN
jgi:radical SAM protein with 4Fe4S-binding SPASM domain